MHAVNHRAKPYQFSLLFKKCVFYVIYQLKLPLRVSFKQVNSINDRYSIVDSISMRSVASC